MLVFLPLELLPLIHSSTATLRKQPETLPSDAHGTRPALTGRLCCPPPSALARPTPLPLLRHGLPRPHRVVPEDPLAHGHTLTRLPGDRSCCPPTPRSLWTGEAPSEHSPRSVTTPPPPGARFPLRCGVSVTPAAAAAVLALLPTFLHRDDTSILSILQIQLGATLMLCPRLVPHILLSV